MASGFRTKQAKLRKRIWRQQGGKCFYCPRHTYLPRRGHAPTKGMATLEHIVPLSRGGARDPKENCVIACYACNQARGNMPIEQFLTALKARTNPHDR